MSTVKDQIDQAVDRLGDELERCRAGSTTIPSSPTRK